MKEKLTPITVTVPQTVKDELKILAVKRGTNLMDIIRKLLEAYLKEAK